MNNDEREKLLLESLKKPNPAFIFKPSNFIRSFYAALEFLNYRKKKEIKEYLYLFADENEKKKADRTYDFLNFFSKIENFPSLFIEHKFKENKKQGRNDIDEALTFIKEHLTDNDLSYSLLLRYFVLKYPQELKVYIDKRKFETQGDDGFIYLKFHNITIGILKFRPLYEYYDQQGKMIDYNLAIIKGLHGIKLGSVIMDTFFKIYDQELKHKYPDGIIGTIVFNDNIKAQHLYKKYGAVFSHGKKEQSLFDYQDDGLAWGYARFYPDAIEENLNKNTKFLTLEEYNKSRNVNK